MFKSASCSFVSGAVLIAVIVGVGLFHAVCFAAPSVEIIAFDYTSEDYPSYIRKGFQIAVTGLDPEQYGLQLQNITFNLNGWQPSESGSGVDDGWQADMTAFRMSYIWGSDLFPGIENSSDYSYYVDVMYGDFDFENWTGWLNENHIIKTGTAGNYAFNVWGGPQYPDPNAPVSSPVDALISSSDMSGLAIVLNGIWAFIISMCCVLVGYTFIKNRLVNVRKGVR